MPARPSKHERPLISPIPPQVHDDDDDDGDDAPPLPIPMPLSQQTRPASGLARTIPTTSKRFTPTPSPAVPVVHLGTASVEHRVEGEEVMWGRWDRVAWRDAPATRLLLVAYPSALRVWDTTDLDNVGEVLRLRPASLGVGAEDARMVHAAVLPGRDGDIGIAFNTGTFVVYSLTAHRTVTRLQIPPTIHSFEASSEFLLIVRHFPLSYATLTPAQSATAPPAIHVLSATTFAQLAEIPRARLALYTPPPAVPAPYVHASATAVLTSAFAGALGSLRQASGGDTVNADEDDAPQSPAPEPPRPVYALSRRLLAYASKSPRARSPHSARQGPPVGVAVGEPQSAAQSVWAGVRTLGGLAVSAAKSRIRRGATSDIAPFFSRSAPESEREVRSGGETEHEGEGAGAGDAEEGVYIVVLDLAPLLRGAQHEGDVVYEMRIDDARGVSKLVFGPDGCTLGVVARDGTHVGVYHLRPSPRPGPGVGVGAGSAWNVYTLRRGRTGAVVEGLTRSADGRWLALATRKRTVHVFAVNPYGGPPDVRSHWEGRVHDAEEPQTTTPCEVGPLVRLRSGGAWTQAPLAFMFVEQEQGDAGIPHHLLPPPSTSPAAVSASASASPTRTSPRPYAPRSFSSQHHSHSHSHSHSHPHSEASGAGSPDAAHAETRKNRKRAGYQDLLVFEPAEVAVVLRRVWLDVRAREPGIGIGIGMGMGISLPSVGGMTSVSLPGAGVAGVGAGSPSSVGGGVGQRAGQYHQYHQQGREAQREVQMELAARESVVMTWSLRAWGAGEGRKLVRPPRRERAGAGGRADWLAHAELSTFSRSPKVLPRSVYLSHQFAFRTLGEDYHALIRRYQLDIAGAKIDVRREVQVSACSPDTGTGTAGAGEGEGEGGMFVEGFVSSRDVHRHNHHHHNSYNHSYNNHHHHNHRHNHHAHHTHQRPLSASFDEPLACALTHELELARARGAGVLPMLPNGTPGAGVRRAAMPMPIRTLGDGVSEGLGRLRRGIGSRVRASVSASAGASAASAAGPGAGVEGVSVSVPLEFDEEDEDFVGGAEGGKGDQVETQEKGVGVGGVVSGDADGLLTPATSEDDWERRLEIREDVWGGWSESDRGAVEEVERFCDVDVVGLLDEEQQEERREREAKMQMQMERERERERQGGDGDGEAKKRRARRRRR
ncbi:hypothetical protein C0992_005035 [Termitomyces sp. T32_za158]|nr:hypothetical protein C0992_005035 [Termitomyces sp. T32_za158]